ncbi:DUF2652 domain-containing protein [Chitinophaga lutea]
MSTQGLLFIPDISGFTRFVTESEIDHSRMIIQELLETLINANDSGLEISEIEGDAILFYRFGEPLDLPKLYRQVARMFTAFHQRLSAYEHRRICQCSACVGAIGLTLKVVTHYGEFTGYNVKNFSKLIGKDVIVAHQLLKNNIEQHEYWLVTESLLPNTEPAMLEHWMYWDKGVKQTETGDIPFHYTQLGALRESLQSPELPNLELQGGQAALTLHREYPVPAKRLFYTAGHFMFRHRWEEGLERIEELEHHLPGIGSRHRRIEGGKPVVMVTSAFHYTPDLISYSERREDGKSEMRYTMETTSPGSSRLTLQYRIPGGLLPRLRFRLFGQKALEGRLRRSMETLEGLLREVEPPEF